MEHRNRKPRIAHLMPARHARAQQGGEFPVHRPPAKGVADGFDRPGFALDERDHARRLGPVRDYPRQRRRIGERRQRGAVFDYAGLFPRDPFGRTRRGAVFGREQKGFMVDAERGDAAHRRRRDDIGRIESSAQPDLDDAIVGGYGRKGKESRRRRHLEKACVQPFRDVEDFAKQGGERRVVDQGARQSDALVEPDEVRAGIGVDPAPLRLQYGAQIGAGRSLAVGPRDMEGPRQPVLRIAEARAQLGDAFQPQYVATRR